MNKHERQIRLDELNQLAIWVNLQPAASVDKAAIAVYILGRVKEFTQDREKK